MNESLTALVNKAHAFANPRPDRKTESFKYCDLARLLAGQTFHEDLAQHQALELTCNMPSIHVMPDGVKPCCLPEGVEVTHFHSLADAQQTHFAERDINFKRHPLAAYNLASNPQVTFIRISNPLQRPIELSYHLNAQNLWWNTLTLIQVDAGAEAEIHTTTEGADSNLFNQLLFIKADDNAKLKMKFCRGKNPLAKHIHNCQIWQQRDSRVDLFYGNDGEAIGRYDAHAYLAAPGAEFRAAGFYRLKKSENVDHHILAEHLADHTKSEQFFKGILDDKSTGTFNGAAHVHAGVKNADARQHNYTLLLSKLATVNAKPELEVYTDVVTAAHGAAIGQLDEEALFYLQSRGIDFEAARRILIDAFFADVLTFFDS